MACYVSARSRAISCAVSVWSRGLSMPQGYARLYVIHGLGFFGARLFALPLIHRSEQKESCIGRVTCLTCMAKGINEGRGMH